MPPRRVLLDECVDRRLAEHIRGHTVQTVQERGWAGAGNGDLLQYAEPNFDVLITVDRNLCFQQNIPQLNVAVIVLCGVTNRLQDLLPLVPQIIQILEDIRSGEVRLVMPC